MVRMTDLLKKIGQASSQKEIPPEEKPSPTPENRPPIAKDEAMQSMAPEKKPLSQGKTIKEKPVQFANLLSGGTKGPVSEATDVAQRFMESVVPNEADTRELYFAAVEEMRKAFNNYKDKGVIPIEEIVDITQKIVTNVMLGSPLLLKLFHEEDSLRFCRFYNAVNVSILGVKMGMVYKYNKSMLLDLAVAGLLHDIELAKHMPVIDKYGKLSPEEFNEVKQHTADGAAFVGNNFKLSEEVIDVILHHHERKDGHGYPAGLAEKNTKELTLTEKNIHELTQIIGIADTYEAMTHSRPYREKMSPHAAILDIISHSANLFTNQVVKALVSCVGLYPVGSMVELNTGEVCKVIMSNPDFPLRPVICVLLNKEREKLTEVRTIDLREVPSLNIKQTFKEQIDPSTSNKEEIDNSSTSNDEQLDSSTSDKEEIDPSTTDKEQIDPSTGNKEEIDDSSTSNNEGGDTI